ncbi:MAG: thiol oxidoreductase-like protein [Proteobacteria bacterium]|nr:thiol oxidoreductase-like protein [Pseudomonadota bacterium]
MTDETQTTPNVPGGAIAKSLEQQVGTGQGDVDTPGSSVYLIKRDPARSIRRGRQLFQRKFTEDQGQGPRVSNDSTGNIQDNPALGAGLADSCAACHGRPRGAAGFGGDVATKPDSRDSPHLFGLGLQEMLADEITADLRERRDLAVAISIFFPFFPITLSLESKGIDYGVIKAQAGNVDTSGVEGVNPDLRVRPFFAQGGTVSMREFLIGAFKAEMGLEAPDPILCSVTDPDSPTVETSPSGFRFDPTQDTFERPPVCDDTEDGDGDGVANEIDTALVDHMEFYLLNYFKPGTGKETARTAQGEALLDAIDCTECHRQNLVIDRDRRVADITTTHNPAQGIFNRLFATTTPLFEVFDDGNEFPQLLPQEGSFTVENIFTDFKRHDLGAAFHERNYDGSLTTDLMTEPLWGVGSTAPYGHDGRSINLEEVILRHGGEAEASRDAFAALSDDDQRKVQEFLGTLILFPPDDTASDLNPGDPDGNPQDPANHGNIALSELFQIPSEGRE